MAESYDAIVIGAGHHGLVCAAYLAYLAYLAGAHRVVTLKDR